MYAGQFANFSGPVGFGTGVGDAGTGVALATGGAVGMLIEAGAPDSDDPVVHAARKAATPAKAVPCRKRRRVRSGLKRWGSLAIGSSSDRTRSGARGSRHPRAGVGISRVDVGIAGGFRDDEAVIGRPGQLDLVAAGPQLGPCRALDVLLVDGQRAAARFDDVLGAHPEIRRIADGAREPVVAGRALGRGLTQPDLLGADADAHSRLAVEEGARDPDRAGVGELRGRVGAVDAD